MSRKDAAAVTAARPIGHWLIAAALIAASGCRKSDSVPQADVKGPASAGSASAGPLFPDLRISKSSADTNLPAVESPQFSDVHAAAGIEFVYENGATGRNLMVESIGGGAGWLDFDADGLQDLYLVQGGNPTRPPSEPGPPDRLYRNLGGGEFEEVGGAAGTTDVGYGQAVAVGDYDGDGFDDVYVTNVGGNTLYRNMGDGTFSDATAAAGVADGRWSASAAWGDLDIDGDLDLYVCNYLIYDPHHPVPCFTDEGEPAVCDPAGLEPSPNECYFNQGDGTFRPEAVARGLEPNDGNSKSLGVVIADLDGDALPDVYVANDTTANYYFVNQGGGRFEELAIPLGCAMNAVGQFQASMGAALGDYDRDGRPDLYLTHFTEDSNTLYRNLGAAGFEDVTRRVGLHQPTLDDLGFGTIMADFNRDGHEDVFVANGHIQDLTHLGFDVAMRPQLFSYAGPRWVEVTDRAGTYFSDKYLGRGVASCDYDADGDLDLAVVHQNAPAALLRNESDRGHWLKVRLTGIESNRRGLGACVAVRCDGQSLVRHLAGGTSFAASNEPALLFEFDEKAVGDCRVEVRWPGGVMQTVDGVPLDSMLVIREARGASAADGREVASGG